MITVPVLPESAPFTPAQRAWLNGFFAGILGGQSTTGNATLPPGVAAGAPTASASEEQFPWHDSALSMDDRLKLAQGKPRERVLMAAMAQLDCGACGYLCKTYAEAIASGAEKCLSLCSPGGAPTAKKLKELLKSLPAHGAPAQAAAPAPPTRPGWDRRNPFAARLVKAACLNTPASEKDTRHVVLDLEGSGLVYEPGDSLGVWPENCPELVEAILKRLGATGDEAVAVASGDEKPFREALLRHYSIGGACDELLEALGLDSENGSDVLDAFARVPGRTILPSELVAKLIPLTPRLYSISSSLKAHPDEVHLTVGVVRYELRGRKRKGVASTYLAERLKPGQRAPVFVQKSHGFRLPSDPATPIVMIGPGTGIAPFRAFLEERKATGAKGKTWLFFGDQRQEHDFLFREELEAFQRDGVLNRLDLAFSRDQESKVYVQHRMKENAGELWRWIQDGAAIYVCGDAKRMASDVDTALREVAKSQAGVPEEEAEAILRDLARTNRYQRDVY